MIIFIIFILIGIIYLNKFFYRIYLIKNFTEIILPMQRIIPRLQSIILHIDNYISRAYIDIETNNNFSISRYNILDAK